MSRRTNYDSPMESTAVEKIKSWTKNPIPYIVIAGILSLILITAFGTILWTGWRRRRKGAQMENNYRERMDEINVKVEKGLLKPIVLLDPSSRSKRSSISSVQTKETIVTAEKPAVSVPVLTRTSPTPEATSHQQSTFIPTASLPALPPPAYLRAEVPDDDVEEEVESPSPAPISARRAKLRRLREQKEEASQSAEA